MEIQKMSSNTPYLSAKLIKFLEENAPLATYKDVEEVLVYTLEKLGERKLFKS